MRLRSRRGALLRPLPLGVALPDRDLHREPVVQCRVGGDPVGDRGLVHLPCAADAAHEDRDALPRARGARTQAYLAHALALVAPERTKARRRARERLAVSLAPP